MAVFENTDCGWWQLLKPFQNRMRVWNILQSQESQERLLTDASLDSRNLQQRLEFTGKGESTVLQTKENGFLAKSIPYDNETLFVGIPECKSKHSSQMSNEIQSILFVEMDDDFGIPVGMELMAMSDQLWPKFP